MQNHHLVNDQIRNGKIKVGRYFGVTKGGSLLNSEIVLCDYKNNFNK